MMTLRGKTILLTRQPAQAEELLQEIQSRGGRALLLPTIKIAPPASWFACDRAMDRLDTYDGFVFTSVNAVRWFFERANERGIGLEALGPRPIWAVGEKTAHEIRSHGLKTEPLPDAFTGASLVDRIRGLAVPPRRLLIPQGELAGDALSSKLVAIGIAAETVVVYRTVPASGREAGEIRSQLSAGEIDVVMFFSPSAARNFAALFEGETLSDVLSGCVVAVIGPTTRNALRGLNVEPAVMAEHATVRGMVDAVEQYFSGSL